MKISSKICTKGVDLDVCGEERNIDNVLIDSYDIEQMNEIWRKVQNIDRFIMVYSEKSSPFHVDK